MSLSWLAQFAFFLFYFIAWLTNQIPHTLWLNVTAIAAIVLAVLLVFDNRTHWGRRDA